MPQPPVYYYYYFPNTTYSNIAICHVKCEVLSGVEFHVLVIWDMKVSDVRKNKYF